MAKLEAKLGMIIDSVGNFFSGKDQLLWCDPDIVAIEEGRAVVVLRSPGAGMSGGDIKIDPNFRDVHGRTGLHWASHFRRPDSMGNYFLVPIYISNCRDVFHFNAREETVIALVKLGAVPGLVDDPKSAFPGGKTAADLASSRGYKGIAGYLAEADLVNQLSRLTVNENEKDNIATNLATDNAFESADTDSSKMTMDEQRYLRESLAAFQKSAYAAASI